MTVLSNQFSDAMKEEDKVRKKGLMNPSRGYVGNGFYWGMYPMSTDEYSGYGGYMTATQQDPVSPMGQTATAADGGGVSAVGGMASN
jgi:hypothetical protein